MINQDLTNSAQENLGLLIDLKTRLHHEREDLLETKEQLSAQIMEFDNSTQVLQARNSQIETILKQQEECGAVGGKALDVESVDKIVRVSDPVSEKIMVLVAK